MGLKHNRLSPTPTPRQAEVLGYIRRATRLCDRTGPTRADISRHFGFSRQNVQRIVLSLRRRGLVSWCSSSKDYALRLPEHEVLARFLRRAGSVLEAAGDTKSTDLWITHLRRSYNQWSAINGNGNQAGQ